MEAFTFSSPLLSGPVRIVQESSRDIGFKLYPAGLLLARHLEAAAARADRGAGLLRSRAGAGGAWRTLELGAGISALPTLLLAGQGAHATASDMPDVLPLLASNLALAATAAARGSVRAACLLWGAAAAGDATAAGAQGSVATLLAAAAADAACAPTACERACACAAPAPPRAIDLIVGADVVYHEHLIEPLLETLLALTATAPAAAGAHAACAVCAERRAPPRVVLAYVQRFKRAKAFFRRAARWFDVTCEPTGAIIDYQQLSWELPGLLARAGGPRGSRYPPNSSSAEGGERGIQMGSAAETVAVDGGEATGSVAIGAEAAAAGAADAPTLTSEAASYDAYVDLLRRAVRASDAAAAAASLASAGAGPLPAGAAADSSSRRSSLSDHGSSDEDAGRAWRAMAGCGGGSGSSSALTPASSDSAAGCGSSAQRQQAEVEALCQRLGLPAVRPTAAYIYTLQRKPPAK